METLKLSALAFLIPFGWLMSEASAYPQPNEMINFETERGLRPNCFRVQEKQSEFKEQNFNSKSQPDSGVDQSAPTITASLYLDRGDPIDVCRLDLDQIDAE